MPPRFPQTAPMAVGSAFDAKVKSYLHERLFGKTSEWSFDKLFEDQVAEEQRDKALATVDDTWALYMETGALSELLLQLDKSILSPHFETRMMKTVTASISTGPPAFVTIMGVPDLMFQTGDCLVILDWKVNGYYSQASPRKGYCLCLPDRIAHKDVFVTEHYGIPMVSAWFEDLYPDWAAQLSTYSWLMGHPVGNRVLNVIHQLAFGNNPRVAIHAGLCSPGFHEALFASYVDLWNRVQSGNIFDEDNEQRCERLNRIAGTMVGDENATYRELIRGY